MILGNLGRVIVIIHNWALRGKIRTYAINGIVISR